MVDREVEMNGFVEVLLKCRREESEQLLQSFISARQGPNKACRQDNRIVPQPRTNDTIAKVEIRSDLNCNNMEKVYDGILFRTYMLYRLFPRTPSILIGPLNLFLNSSIRRLPSNVVMMVWKMDT